MQHLLIKILITIIALNVFTIGIMVISLMNARINVRRSIIRRRFQLKLFESAKTVTTSQEAALNLDISVEKFKEYCADYQIEAPEERIARDEQIDMKKQEGQRRIMAEEAAWRAEQEKETLQQKEAQEEKIKARQDRLRKFGFK